MRLTLPGGVSAEILVRSEQTDGRLCVLRDHLPAGWALPPHQHGNESETFTVLSGRLGMTIDGTSEELGAGDVAHVPAGVRHDGAVIGNDPVTRVVIFSPGGMETFFERLADLRADTREALRLAIDYGWRFD